MSLCNQETNTYKAFELFQHLHSLDIPCCIQKTIICKAVHT